MEAVGALSPGGPHTHTAEDLQAVVASRHVYPALKDCDPRSTAVRAHWGHHCPPSGKRQSRSGAMRAGVPVPQDSLERFGRTVLCSLAPGQPPHRLAPPPRSAPGFLWLPPVPCLRPMAALCSALPACPQRPLTDLLLPCTPRLVNGTTHYLVPYL